MRYAKFLPTFSVGVALAASMAMADGSGPASRPLLTVDHNISAGVAAFVQGGTRDLDVDGVGTLNVSLLRVAGRASADIWPFLALYGGVGWCEAEIDNVTGEGGLSLEAGGLVNLLEYDLDAKSIGLESQTLGLAVDVNYSWWESNFGRTDFHWGELTITPQVAYTVKRHGAVAIHSYEPELATLRSGLAFTQVDGSYGDASVRSDRDFGGFVAGDVMLRNDWIVSLDALVYGGDDRLVRLLFGRYF